MRRLAITAIALAGALLGTSAMAQSMRGSPWAGPSQTQIDMLAARQLHDDLASQGFRGVERDLEVCYGHSHAPDAVRFCLTEDIGAKVGDDIRKRQAPPFMNSPYFSDIAFAHRVAHFGAVVFGPDSAALNRYIVRNARPVWDTSQVQN